MLIGVTWQLGLVILVLIELIISLVLLLIEFHVIKGEFDVSVSRESYTVNLKSLFVESAYRPV